MIIMGILPSEISKLRPLNKFLQSVDLTKGYLTISFLEPIKLANGINFTFFVSK